LFAFVDKHGARLYNLRVRAKKGSKMDKLVNIIERRHMTRIVAFGSSNTELGYHCEGHFNWFNWLEVGLAAHVGRKMTCINTGVSGNICAQLLERFDRDCALFKPNIVIVTIGGNDSNPDRGITREMFREDLETLAGKVDCLDDAVLVLQTYYTFDAEKFSAKERGWAESFPAYMQVVRETASAGGYTLIDHQKRWELLRKNDAVLYRGLMRDPKHLKPLGNMVMGLDTLRAFGAGLYGELPSQCAEGLKIQGIMDKLETEGRK